MASDWVEARAEIGDLILTGSDDRVSRIIQRASGSEFSHAAVVTDVGMVTEAYDYALTLSEDDEGVYHTSFEEFFARVPKLRTVLILRPGELITERLQSEAHNLRRRSPPYPTVGATKLGFIRLLSETIPLVEEGLLGQRVIGKRLHRRLDQIAKVQVRFVGDGVRKIHCAESVIMLYRRAGIEVELPHPYLRRTAIRAESLQNDGSIQRHARKATRGVWRARRTRQRVLRIIIGSHQAIEELAYVLRTRRTHIHDVSPEDYVFPSDLEHMKGFSRVDMLSIKRPQRRRRLPGLRSRP